MGIVRKAVAQELFERGAAGFPAELESAAGASLRGIAKLRNAIPAICVPSNSKLESLVNSTRKKDRTSVRTADMATGVPK